MTYVNKLCIIFSRKNIALWNACAMCSVNKMPTLQLKR